MPMGTNSHYSLLQFLINWSIFLKLRIILFFFFFLSLEATLAERAASTGLPSSGQGSPPSHLPSLQPPKPGLAIPAHCAGPDQTLLTNGETGKTGQALAIPGWVVAVSFQSSKDSTNDS